VVQHTLTNEAWYVIPPKFAFKIWNSYEKHLNPIRNIDEIVNANDYKMDLNCRLDLNMKTRYLKVEKIPTTQNITNCGAHQFANKIGNKGAYLCKPKTSSRINIYYFR